MLKSLTPLLVLSAAIHGVAIELDTMASLSSIDLFVRSEKLYKAEGFLKSQGAP